ncbi:hypothetical protein F2Q70_00031330 [Brassica cretica]|uniref:Uncharacterized protein n=1 Tax=Brassica cretica TaxID=69181 RepID=A0A8S9FVJ6_BRACR|nr:hypothetical protein F2Q70_00031330 [Brassica cretica]KAF2554235.1 hypothetical protein F2Q68_00035750 [Brassica cretica]
MPSRLLPRLGPARRRHRPLHTRARTCSLLSSPPDLPLLHLLPPSRRRRVFFPSLLCRVGESMSVSASSAVKLNPKSFHTRAFLPLLANDSWAGHTRAPCWLRRC